jgi:hypothetical protein
MKGLKMAGIGLKLLKKLTARQRKIREKQRTYGEFDSRYRQEEVLQVSQKAYLSQRGIQRRLESNFGNSGLSNQAKPQLSMNWYLEASSVTTILYPSSPTGYALQLTFAGTLISEVGIQPNDVIKFRSGVLANQEFLVLAVTSPTTIVVSDSSEFSATGTEEIQTVTTVADSSGSLNDTYFIIYSALNAKEYYVWYNINGAGVDPSVRGATGIEVSAATNASANTIASDTAAALAAVAGNPFTASATTDVVTVTNNRAGVTTAAYDSGVPTGFAFAVTQAGTTASETDIYVRALLMTQVADFTQQLSVEQSGPSEG